MNCFLCNAPAAVVIARPETGAVFATCNACADPYRADEGLIVTPMDPPAAPVSSSDLPSAPSPESAPVPGPMDTIPIS